MVVVCKPDCDVYWGLPFGLKEHDLGSALHYYLFSVHAARSTLQARARSHVPNNCRKLKCKVREP